MCKILQCSTVYGCFIFGQDVESALLIGSDSTLFALIKEAEKFVTHTRWFIMIVQVGYRRMNSKSLTVQQITTD
jgi:hypothetical protein